MFPASTDFLALIRTPTDSQPQLETVRMRVPKKSPLCSLRAPLAEVLTRPGDLPERRRERARGPLKLPRSGGTWPPVAARSALRLAASPNDRLRESKGLTDQRSGEVDWLATARFRPIDYPRPLEMLFRVKPSTTFAPAPETLRAHESPMDSTHADHRLPIFNHGFAWRKREILSPDDAPEFSDTLPVPRLRGMTNSLPM
jgi:hypothetical protein